jgi:hypothetical protein
LARAKKTEFSLSNQSCLFRNLQTVSTKGKKCFKGIGSASTSKSNFDLLGKGLDWEIILILLRSFKQKGTLSSSLKRWEVQFGKRKLCIGLAGESGLIINK